MKLTLLVLVSLAIVAVLGACGAPAPSPAPAPPPAPAPAVSPPAPAGPSALFADNCAMCHGLKREGMPNLGPALTPERLGSRDDAELKETITKGRPGTAMPPWGGKITDAQIDSLIQFIKTVTPQ